MSSTHVKIDFPLPGDPTQHRTFLARSLRSHFTKECSCKSQAPVPEIRRDCTLSCIELYSAVFRHSQSLREISCPVHCPVPRRAADCGSTEGFEEKLHQFEH